MAAPLIGLAAVIVTVFGGWSLSALASSAGMGLAAATGAAALVVLGVPLVIVAYKHGRRVLEPLPAVAAVWNVAVLVMLVIALPDPLGVALRTQGWALSAHAVGEEHQATRTASMLSHEVADRVGAKLDAPPIEVPTHPRSVAVQVELQGPSGRLEQRYLWDTGASYTTITTDVAREIGIVIPKDAPKVSLDTALGRRDAALVYLPALSIEGHEIRGIAASICDECAHDTTGGLLGLNAMRHFVSELDGPLGRLQLRAAPVADRTLDIVPFVDLEIEGEPTLIGGHAHWRVRVTNHAQRTLTSVQPYVTFSHGTTLSGEVIATVPPGETVHSRVVGSVGKGAGGRFELALLAADW